MGFRSAQTLANEQTAAYLLDMKPAEFRSLVEGGHLPGPCDIGGFKRWYVEELRRIAAGEVIDNMSDVRW